MSEGVAGLRGDHCPALVRVSGVAVEVLPGGVEPDDQRLAASAEVSCCQNAAVADDDALRLFAHFGRSSRAVAKNPLVLF